MDRVRAVLTLALFAVGLGACATAPPPAPPEPRSFDVKTLEEGMLAALPPLGVVLVKGRSVDDAGTASWNFANDMKTLTIPEGALVALGIRKLASPAEIAWARAFLVSDVEAPGPEDYDARRAMAWMEAMRSGRFVALVQSFGELCAVSDARELQAVEKSLLDTARVWLVAEFSAVEMTPPDVTDAWLADECPALSR